jgi:hypothetical protein
MIHASRTRGAGLDTHFSQIVYANAWLRRRIPHSCLRWRCHSSPMQGRDATRLMVCREPPIQATDAPDVIGKTAARRALRRLGA